MTDGERKLRGICIENFLKGLLIGMMFAMIVFLLVVVLSGCIWRSANIDEYANGKLIKHTGIGEVGILNIASRKGFVLETDEIKARVAESTYKPDPESIKAVSDGMLTEIFKMWSVL